MKKILFQILCIIPTVLIFSTAGHAEIEWKTRNSIVLDETPVDVAISKDGLTTYILCENTIQIHSKFENKITDRIPLSSKFTQIALSPDGRNLLLTDTENKKISVIEIMQIFNIEIGDSPVIGKAQAPVNIVVFTDYQ